MSTDIVTHEIRGRVSYLTLNRPDKLNAIDEALRQRAVELGGDTSWRRDTLVWRALLLECLEFEMRPMEMTKPVIASVAGYALGGACELAMLCDLTICADDARFGEPEVRFSNVGPAMIMPFVAGHKRARELLYMGDLIDARTALECNMVNRVVPAAELEAETEKYANRLALLDEEALYGTKLALRRGLEAAGIRSALLNGVDVLAAMYAAKTESGERFGEITREQGLRAALKWRHAQFEE